MACCDRRTFDLSQLIRASRSSPLNLKRVVSPQCVTGSLGPGGQPAESRFCVRTSTRGVMYFRRKTSAGRAYLQIV
jgi:hypothetical protein